MLVCRPKARLFWNYSVTRDEIVVAEVDFDNPTETGAIRIGDKAYTVPDHRSSNPAECKLFAGDSLIATALKPSIFKSNFIIATSEFTFELLRTGLLTKKSQIRRGEQILGEITKQGWASQTLQIEIADTLPLHLQLFSFWLSVMLWYRESGS